MTAREPEAGFTAMRRAGRPVAAAALIATAAFLLAFVEAASASPDAGQQPARLFVVSAIGDSYGAGEGAPQIEGVYAYSTTTKRWVGVPAAVWDNTDGAAARCHRSPSSGFGQAIARVRRTFAAHDVTVTFRTVACSGASIRFGIDPLTGLRKDGPEGGGALTPYCGAAPTSCPGSQAPIAPQVQQLRSIFGMTPVDALLVSFGGNDFGFARTIFVCTITQYLADPDGLLPSGAVPCDTDATLELMLQAASAPTTASVLESGLAELVRGDSLGPDALVRGCAFLSRNAVVTRTCTPTFRASFDLLGRALDARTARTFVRCNLAQETAAEAAWVAAHPLAFSAAPVGTVDSLSGCVKSQANSVTDPLGIWVRTEAAYPSLSRAPDRIYIATYPDAVEDETGTLCNDRPSDDRLTRKLVTSESSFIRAEVRAVLNREIREAAARNGWTVIELPVAFRHGICATAANRWFNTNRDALARQGEIGPTTAMVSAFRAARDTLGRSDGEPALGGGMAHPNATGYRQLYSWRVGNRLRLQICDKFDISPCPPLQA
jgi:hypothetical protein